MELEPCPFCGSEAMLEAQFGRDWWVQCSNMECNATSSAIEPTPQAAEDWWNRRASIPPNTPVEAGKVGVADGVRVVPPSPSMDPQRLRELAQEKLDQRITALAVAHCADEFDDGGFLCYSFQFPGLREFVKESARLDITSGLESK